jgi:hypothetical protein
MKDAEIDYSDIPPLNKSFFAKAQGDRIQVTPRRNRGQRPGRLT